MKIIVGDKTVLLDDEDAHLLNGARLLVRRNRNTFYALLGGRFLHRLVLDAKKGQVVDHINSDGLDNRSINLRFCSVGQNRQRSKLSKQKAQSGYRGVHKSQRGRWKASIWHKNIFVYLGRYSTKEEAAMAYDAKARELFGSLAATNF